MEDRTSETWRRVVGFEGMYEVSNLGNVRSVDRVLLLSNGRTQRRKGQPLAPVPHVRTGHMQVNLAGDTRYVHDLVLQAFRGPRPDGLIALHGNDDTTDNTLSNLRWGTYGDNNYDAVRNGTHYSAGKVTCPRGHDLVHPNLTRSDLPRRGCKACHRAYASTVGQERTPELLQAESDRHYVRIMGWAA